MSFLPSLLLGLIVVMAGVQLSVLWRARRQPASCYLREAREIVTCSIFTANAVGPAGRLPR